MTQPQSGINCETSNFGVKQISLSNSELIALVDESDYLLVSKHKWYAYRHVNRRVWYARTRDGLLMHRLVLNAPKGQRVDHANCDGLDNRRSNLRFASRSQDGANRRKYVGEYSSKYKGVSLRRDRKKWLARITIGKRTLHLGYFDIEEEAARAYDEAARSYFGSFAKTNFR